MRNLMMMRMVGGLGLALVAAVPVSAQLASPSPAALGMGDSYTAAARGYSATAWNPAGLGLSGNPGFSMSIASMRALAGIDPITLTDFQDYEGKVVPTAVKTQWLNTIREEGGEAGTSGFDANWLALQVGRVGVQVTTSARALANLSPGVAELLMFGNVDAAGNPQAIALGGSSVDLAAYTTAALSFAQPITLADGESRLSVGLTAKYTVGHFMMIGTESSGSTTVDPVSVSLRFPLVHTPIEDDEGGFEGNSGSGVGLDVGVAYETGAWTFAAAVQNIMNTFEWDQSLLRYRRGLILFDDELDTEFESVPFSAASDVPAALASAVEEASFKPVIAAGASGQLLPTLTVSADVRLGSEGGIRAVPRTHVGGGLEYQLLPFLPIRVGVAYVQVDSENSGMQLGGGFDLRLGPLTLSAAAAQRSTGLGKDSVFMVSLLSFQ